MPSAVAPVLSITVGSVRELVSIGTLQLCSRHQRWITGRQESSSKRATITISPQETATRSHRLRTRTTTVKVAHK